MWAVEKYIGQWDGYAGRDGETWLPNNYYLYSDPNGASRCCPGATTKAGRRRTTFLSTAGPA